MQRKEAIRAIIIQFENETIDFQTAQNQIQAVCGKEVFYEELAHYWCSTDLDTFCEVLATEPIADWQEINEERALSLMLEILADTTNEPILTRNAEALEKRFRKPSGTVSDLIFYADLTATKILQELQKDTNIYL